MNLGTKETKAGRLNHLKTLADVVDYYRANYKYEAGVVHSGTERSADHHDPLVDRCKVAPSLIQAIRIGCSGRRGNGKMFSEDSCISHKARAIFTERLVDYRSALRECKTFEELHDKIAAMAPAGVGVLMVYNVTSRVGAFLKIHSRDFAYLHAGPLKGWKRLTGTKKNPVRVAMEWVPPPLNQLPPHRVEDFLCEFSELLHPGLLKGGRYVEGAAASE